MMNGCKREICINIYCKNNPNFVNPANSQEMLQLALKLWAEYVD